MHSAYQNANLPHLPIKMSRFGSKFCLPCSYFFFRTWSVQRAVDRMHGSNTARLDSESRSLIPRLGNRSSRSIELSSFSSVSYFTFQSFAVVVKVMLPY